MTAYNAGLNELIIDWNESLQIDKRADISDDNLDIWAYPR